MGGGGGGEVGVSQQQIAEQQINARLWNYYREFYRPLLEKYAEQVMGPGTKEQEKRQVAGQINAEIMKGVDTSKASMNPVQNTKTISALAGGSTGAQVKGQGAVRGRQLGEMENLINIGRGEAAIAQAGMGELAAQSLRGEMGRVESEQQERAGTENMYGSLIGAAGGVAYNAFKTPAKKLTLDPKLQSDWFALT